MLTLKVEQRRQVPSFEAGIVVHTYICANAPGNWQATKNIFAGVLCRDACVRGETGAKMRATGGLVRQSAADGLKKRSSLSFGPAKKPGAAERLSARLLCWRRGQCP